MNKVIILLAFLLLAGVSQGQEKGHYLKLNGGAGLPGLKYDLNNGDTSHKLSYTFNAGYSYFFNPNWGITTGLGLTTTRSSALLNFQDKEVAIDTDLDTYEFRTNFANWKEKQNALFLDIPVGLEFHRQLGKKTGLLASAGTKVSIPVSPSYKVQSGSLTTTGYYSEWNVELHDLPQHGFATINDRYTGDISLKTSVSAFAEIGVLKSLSERTSLYLGGYLDYGLNNLDKGGDAHVYASNGTYTHVLASSQTDKVKLISCGLKIGLRWNAKAKKKETPVVSVPVAPAAPAHPQPQAVVEEKPIEKQAEQIDPKQQAEDEAFRKATEIAKNTKIRFALNAIIPIKPVSEETLNALSEILKKTESLKIRIQGHTCNMGSREANQRIGMQRALTIKKLFEKKDVPDEKMVTESKGFDQPLLPNTSIENRKENRRVELLIEKKE